MNAFETWKASLPAGQDYSAEEAFNAGMTAAAEVCRKRRDLFPDVTPAQWAVRGMAVECAEHIESARDAT